MSKLACKAVICVDTAKGSLTSLGLMLDDIKQFNPEIVIAISENINKNVKKSLKKSMEIIENLPNDTEGEV